MSLQPAKGNASCEQAESRSLVVRKNIVYLVLIKALNILCSLMVVPLALNYLPDDQYGVWLTLSSILVWFFFFDVGLGNGFRNYLTQAISSRDYGMASRYLSTTLVLLCLLCSVFALVSLPAPFLFDLQKLLNVDSVDAGLLQKVFVVSVLFTLANFVVKNVGVVFIAMQKYAWNEMLVFLGHLLGLVAIWLLTLYTEGSLLYVAVVFTTSPLVVFLMAGVYLFVRYPVLRFSFSAVDFSLARQLMGMGLSFFLIQISSCLVIYGSSNLFIAHYCDPGAVVTYNIAYKYFNVLALAFTILIAPLWSAYTDAHVKGDYAWIRKTFHRSLRLWLLTLGAALVMVLVSPWIYALWVKDAVSIPLSISAITALYLCLFNLNNCVTYLLNGLNIVRVQLIISVGITLFYFGLVSYLGPLWGVEGVLLSMSLAYFILSGVHFYQCRLLLNRRAKGIWAR